MNKLISDGSCGIVLCVRGCIRASDGHRHCSRIKECGVLSSVSRRIVKSVSDRLTFTKSANGRGGGRIVDQVTGVIEGNGGAELGLETIQLVIGIAQRGDTERITVDVRIVGNQGCLSNRRRLIVRKRRR